MSTPEGKLEENLHKTGVLIYSAVVNDRKIGQDKYTEVRIQPQHHLSDIYIRLVISTELSSE